MTNNRIDLRNKIRCCVHLESIYLLLLLLMLLLFPIRVCYYPWSAFLLIN
eukprot:UN08417